jgi:Neurotransmitter-gated ion-channel ligand binding domain/Neurotransmitter-gated ion-channel transmembrane region
LLHDWRPSDKLKLVILFLLVILAPGVVNGGPPPESSDPPPTILVPPPANLQPVVVRVGVYILNLVALDEVEQTFTCTGYLTETWTDPRLAFTPKSGESSERYYQRSEIWFPLLQFDNSTAPRKISGFLLIGSPDGTVRYLEKFSVKVSSNMHLRSFPFDEQDLEIYIHPFTPQRKRVMLTADPDSTGISGESYTPLPLWDTSTVTYRSVTGHLGKGDQARSHFVFGIHVKRHSEYYVFRIFVPLFLMVAISWGVLWIPPTDLNSQLLISVTTVLTLVAFSVAVSNVLPPVPYVTFYDSFFLVCFFFILLTIGEAIVVHTIHGKNRTTAVRLRTSTRRLFLPLFVVFASLMAFIFLRT